MKRTLPIFSLAIAAALAIRVQAQAPPELAGQGGSAAAYRLRPNYFVSLDRIAFTLGSYFPARVGAY